ncbi:MAG: sucrose phosphorylase [Puniceicoccaceae bacterium 5H]|nr:MAG: sucrose phosphorylase [Puniceicoccaceae bacterium 5H]
MKFINKEKAQLIQRRLTRLYGDKAPRLMERFYMLLGRYGIGEDVAQHTRYWDEYDVALITYADSLQGDGEPPLRVLHNFANKHLRGAVSIIHLLPFYPWSSDDGFSVIDYRKVKSEYGSWGDVEQIGRDFSLAFDLVLNHCSRESRWFKDFVTGIAPARDYFHVLDPKTDTSEVVRPRPWPLLTRTATRDGDAWVWTTFSEDQVDLNWSNPDVLFEFLDILFFYLSKGCRIFRLDAVAFLWKQIGTSCIHLPETHEVVKLFRDVLDTVAPDAVLLTETNVPHKENVSYFGQGDEAHMVYNFSLPPLLLHGLLRGETTHLTEWAKSLPKLPDGQTFFNFTASHDGVGVRPLQGILEEEELDWVVEQVREKGGRVSMRALGDGTERPYELNITYVDALGDPDDEDLGIARFLCSQAVALAFQGVPAVYIHSLLGTPNWQEGVEQTGHNRTINRRKWQVGELTDVLADPENKQNRIYSRYLQWLRRRAGQPAFHPDGAMEILDLGTKLFGFVRKGRYGNQHIVCLFNFTAEPQTVKLSDLHPKLGEAGGARDILNARDVETGPKAKLTLEPYFAHWIAVNI